jgi:hypothetical protein
MNHSKRSGTSAMIAHWSRVLVPVDQTMNVTDTVQSAYDGVDVQ